MSFVNEGSVGVASCQNTVRGDTSDFEYESESESMTSEYSCYNLPKNPLKVIRCENSDSEESLSITYSDQDCEDYYLHQEEYDTHGGDQRHLPS